MKLQTPKLVQGQDIAGAPQWATRLLSAINSSMEQVSSILQKQASLKDNMNAEIFELKLGDSCETILKLNTLRGPPRHLRVTWSDIAAFPKWYWRPSSEDSRAVIVSVTWDTAPTESVLTRIVVEGD